MARDRIPTLWRENMMAGRALWKPLELPLSFKRVNLGEVAHPWGHCRDKCRPQRQESDLCRHQMAVGLWTVVHLISWSPQWCPAAVSDAASLLEHISMAAGRMERLIKDSIMVSLGRPHPERMGFCLIGCGIYFHQRPILYGAVSPTHGSENQGVKMDLVLLTIILNNPFVEFLLLILATLSSAEYIFGLFNSRLHVSCSFEHKYMLYTVRTYSYIFTELSHSGNLSRM